MTRGDTVHVKTCPQGEDSSLLAAISKTLAENTKKDEL